MRHHSRLTTERLAFPGIALRRLTCGAAFFACVLGLVTFAPRAQAAVTLVYVRAIPRADGPILVQWGTATELDTVGFRIYRGPAESGPFDHLVCAEAASPLGGLIGASYECLDSDVTFGVTYYYRLSEIPASNTAQVIPYPEFIAQATAGVLTTPTATATATATPTATATQATGSSLTATRTATPTATVTATAAPPEQPTATRRYTNTPAPNAPAAASATPAAAAGTVAPTRQATVTVTAAAAVTTPTGQPAPAASPTASVPLPTMPSLPRPEQFAPTPAPPTPTGATTAVPSATASPTGTPIVFSPKGSTPTSPPILRGTPTRLAAAPAQGGARPIGPAALLGGGALIVAVAAGAAAFVLWRKRRAP